MTTEEKAKAYDMALEAARKELGVDRKEWEVVQRVLRNIFPELRESKDERTRNEIIAFIEQAIHSGGGISVPKEKEDKWLAYLEKQKDHFRDDTKMVEQKPAEDKAFEEWIDDWWKHNKVNNPDSYDKGDEIQFDEKGFKNFCRGIRNMYANQESADDERGGGRVGLCYHHRNKCNIILVATSQRINGWRQGSHNCL